MEKEPYCCYETVEVPVNVIQPSDTNINQKTKIDHLAKARDKISKSSFQYLLQETPNMSGYGSKQQNKIYKQSPWRGAQQ